MVSTERVLNYCKVPQEANLKSEPNNKPPGDWPAKGNIEVRQLRPAMRRAEAPPSLVLRVSFVLDVVKQQRGR